MNTSNHGRQKKGLTWFQKSRGCFRRGVVRPTGVEPVAYSSGGCRSIQTELRAQKLSLELYQKPKTLKET
jgi:hypothetical protein